MATLPTYKFEAAFGAHPTTSAEASIVVGTGITDYSVTVGTSGILAQSSVGAGSSPPLYLEDVDGGVWVETPTGGGWTQSRAATGTVPDSVILTDANGVDWRIIVSTSGVVSTTPAWVDLSDRLGDPEGAEGGGIGWSVGRQNELNQMEAGTGTVVLDNTDRALDPTNEASDYWPYVRPMTKVRLRATHSATTYTVFEGFVESWEPTWRDPANAWVTLPIVDATALLAQAKTSASYSSQASGARIGALLDAAGWPTGKRDVDTGATTLQALSAAERNVLATLRDTEATEDGTFFIAADGDATFRDRHSRITSASAATFGDSTGELPYAQLDVSYDADRLYNDVTVTAEGLAAQNADDDVSVAKYGRRWLDLSSLHTTTSEALNAAQWLVGRYKDPRLRFDAIVLEGHHDDDVMTQILTRALGDRVTVKRTPVGGGDRIVQEAFIEKIAHTIQGVTWTTTWQLSPADADTVWQLGTAGFTELGSTTRLGY